MAQHSNVLVELVDVNATNWRAVTKVKPYPAQEQFVSSITQSLCLCFYEQLWHPLAVMHAGQVVGFIMWAIDPADGSYWIGGVVIDAASQHQGIGRAALTLLIEQLSAHPDCREIALSFEPDNHVARKLYADLGFKETGEIENDELVARRAVG